jgi:uncharacterized protein
MRVVFDTNVLIAAFVARNGICFRIIEEGMANHEVFVSPFILSELARGLERKAGVEKPLVDRAIESLIGAAGLVAPIDVPASAIRDPDDRAILGTAVAAHADVIVSGDKDLIALGSFESIPHSHSTSVLRPVPGGAPVNCQSHQGKPCRQTIITS